MKKLGTRTKAYHAANIEPHQARLIEARAVFEKASELKRKMERSIESAEQASTPSEINFASNASVCTELMHTISGHNVWDMESCDSF